MAIAGITRIYVVPKYDNLAIIRPFNRSLITTEAPNTVPTVDVRG